MKYKSIVFTAVLLMLQLCCSILWARPTTAYEAENVVAGWLEIDATPLGTILGPQVASVETYFDDDGEPVYYIVYLQPSGFVIVPADDLVEPIIGFVAKGTYDPSVENPLGALVSQDVPARVAAVRAVPQTQMLPESQTVSDAQSKWSQFIALTEEPDGVGILTAGQMWISDLWVPPLVQTKWGQETCFGGPGKPRLACYNYYTPPFTTPDGDPNNYPCGCVATAMAQLMRYHRHANDPNGIGVHSFGITIGNDPNIVIVQTRGGEDAGGRYDWNSMIENLNVGSTLTTRKAIGRLCFDAGISVNMHYTASGSSASLSKATMALRDPNLFNYSNAIYGLGPWMPGGIQDLISMINPNLDYAHPVILSLTGEIPHAVLADGYGYHTSLLYHHLNMGHEGVGDAFYSFNTVMPTGYGPVGKCVYNIFILGQGEIISGRVTESFGAPISGATVTAQGGNGPYYATTNSRGIYAIAPVDPNTDFTVSVNKGGYIFSSRNVKTGISTDSSSTSGNLWAIDFVGNIDLSCVYVDDDAPNDPGPGDPTISDPNENGSPNHPFDSIQEAVNAVFVGGTVIVSNGTYTGPGNRDIDFGGKVATVRSVDPNDAAVVAATVIDCQGTVGNPRRGFYFHSNEGANSVITGLTVTNGYGLFDSLYNRTVGGGIYCDNSSPTIIRCTITGNSAEAGGGICCNNSSPTIIRCTISNNSATTFVGGGIYYSESSSLTVRHCTISGNLAVSGFGGGICGWFNGSLTISNCIFIGNSANTGGAIVCPGDDFTISNCTISDNSATTACGGVVFGDRVATMSNCILWGNSDSGGTDESAQIALGGTATPVVNYNCIQGWTGSLVGLGNIDADPIFVNANNLHLLPDSPCIDAGDNSSVPGCVTTDLDGLTRIVDGDCDTTATVDMGAYEFDFLYIGDFEGDDCDVDLGDFSVLAYSWQQDDPAIDIAPFLEPDGIIDLKELLVMANHWLEGAVP